MALSIVVLGAGLVAGLWYGFLQEKYMEPIIREQVRKTAEAKQKLYRNIYAQSQGEKFVADALGEQRKYAEALAHLNTRVELLEILTGAQPNDAIWLIRCGGAHADIARLCMDAKDYDTAEKAQKKQLEILNWLGSQPSLMGPAALHHARLAECIQMQGAIEEARGNAAAAEKYYRASAEVLQEPHSYLYGTVSDEIVAAWCRRYRPLIFLCLSQKNETEAVNYLDKTIRDNKTLKGVWKVIGLASSARCYARIAIINDEKKNYTKRLVALNLELATRKETIKFYRQPVKGEYRGIATCFNNIGNTYFQLKDYKAAIQNYNSSWEELKGLLKENPQDIELTALLAQMHFGLAEALEKDKQYEETLLHYTGALSTWRSLVREMGNKPLWRNSYALSAFRLARLFLRQERLEAALPLADVASELQQPLMAEMPANTQWQDELADMLEMKGDCEASARNYRAAVISYRACSVIRQKLSDANKSSVLGLRDLASILSELGRACRAANMLPEAGEVLEKAIAVHQSVCDLELTNGQDLGNLGVAYFDFAVVQMLQKKYAEASKAFTSHRGILERILESNPNNPVYSQALADTLGNLGACQLFLKEPDSALTALQAELALRNRMVEEDPTEVARHQKLADCLLNLAVALQSLKDPAAALKSQQAAADRLTQALKLQPNNPVVIENLLKCYRKIRDENMKGRNRQIAWEANDASLKILEKLVNDTSEPSMYNLANLGQCYLYAGQKWEAEKNQHEVLKTFLAAAEVSRKMAAREPKATAWQSNLANCLRNIALTYRAQGAFTQACATYEESADALQVLIRLDPDNAQWPNRLATVYRDLADALHDRKKEPEAEEARLKALDIYQAAYDKDSAKESSVDDLGDGLFDLAKSRQARENWSDAEKNLRASIELRQKLVNDSPETLPYLWNLTQSYHQLATTLVQSAQYDKARETFVRALKLYGDLNDLTKDKTTSRYSSQNCHRGDCYRDLAELELNHGDKSRCVENYLAASNSYKMAADAPSGDSTCRRKQARAMHSLGGYYRQEKNFQASAESYQAAMEIYRKLLQDSPDSIMLQTDMAQSLYWLAMAQKELNQLPAARASFQSAIDFRKTLVEKVPAELIHLVDLSYAYEGFSLVAEAQQDLPAAAQAMELGIAAIKAIPEKNTDIVDSLTTLSTKLERLALLRQKQGNTSAAQDLNAQSLALLQKLETAGKLPPAHQDRLKKLRETVAAQPKP
ncbi:MAG TPA: tetratricopeptide repeat protein [Candidatus Methylacidiphilales bacterium]|nr:tetratricopeptide repeat protein [Candidatus Methylacidiphilales bacterium]